MWAHSNLFTCLLLRYGFFPRVPLNGTFQCGADDAVSLGGVLGTSLNKIYQFLTPRGPPGWPGEWLPRTLLVSGGVPCTSSWEHVCDPQLVWERKFLQLQPSVCKPGRRAPWVCEMRGNPQTNNCIGGDWRHRQIMTIDYEQAAHTTRRSKRQIFTVLAYGFMCLLPGTSGKVCLLFWRAPCWTQHPQGWTQPAWEWLSATA